MPDCDGNLLACERALLFGRAKRAARGRGKESDHCKLSRTLLWRLLSRAPCASTFHNIPQMESLLEANNLLVASCTLCSSKKIKVFRPYKQNEPVEQRDIQPSQQKKRGQRGVVNAHVKFVTLKVALPTRKYIPVQEKGACSLGRHKKLFGLGIKESIWPPFRRNFAYMLIFTTKRPRT